MLCVCESEMQHRRGRDTGVLENTSHHVLYLRILRTRAEKGTTSGFAALATRGGARRSATSMTEAPESCCSLTILTSRYSLIAEYPTKLRHDRGRSLFSRTNFGGWWSLL